MAFVVTSVSDAFEIVGACVYAFELQYNYNHDIKGQRSFACSCLPSATSSYLLRTSMCALTDGRLILFRMCDREIRCWSRECKKSSMHKLD